MTSRSLAAEATPEATAFFAPPPIAGAAAPPPAHHVAGGPPARAALLTVSGKARADIAFASVTAI